MRIFCGAVVSLGCANMPAQAEVWVPRFAAITGIVERVDANAVMVISEGAGAMGIPNGQPEYRIRQYRLDIEPMSLALIVQNRRVFCSVVYELETEYVASCHPVIDRKDRRFSNTSRHRGYWSVATVASLFQLGEVRCSQQDLAFEKTPEEFRRSQVKYRNIPNDWSCAKLDEPREHVGLKNLFEHRRQEIAR